MFMRTQISGKKSRMGKFYKKGRNRIYEVCKENGVIRTMARTIISALTLVHSKNYLD